LEKYPHEPGEIFDPLVEGQSRELTPVDLIESIRKDYGGNAEDYTRLSEGIAFHESKTLVDKQWTYMNADKHQEGGGPGRGLYQFEEGKNAGGITAVRRAMNYLNLKGFEIPQWLSDANQKDSLDASKLNPKQQEILFWSTHRMGPSKLSSYIKGDIDVEEFWAKYHQTSNDPAKRKVFKADYKIYLPGLWRRPINPKF